MGHKEHIKVLTDFLIENSGIIEQQPEVPDSLFKAGILPFVRMGNRIEYLFMKPISKHGSDPGIQIAKGSRLYMLDGRWEDSKNNTALATNPKASAESILINALREGMEELGIETANIKRILSGFITIFRANRTGEERQMFLLPVEVKSKENFSKNLPDGIAELIWLQSKDFNKLRPDFAEVAKMVELRVSPTASLRL